MFFDVREAQLRFLSQEDKLNWHYGNERLQYCMDRIEEFANKGEIRMSDSEPEYWKCVMQCVHEAVPESVKVLEDGFIVVRIPS